MPEIAVSEVNTGYRLLITEYWLPITLSRCGFVSFL
jgi:hypothetical protein